jgi:hypothetical protein
MELFGFHMDIGITNRGDVVCVGICWCGGLVVCAKGGVEDGPWE